MEENLKKFLTISPFPGFAHLPPHRRIAQNPSPLPRFPHIFRESRIDCKQNLQKEDIFMNNEATTGIGYLIVRVTTANGAIPLSDATVVIRGNTPETSGVMHTQYTDRDGTTQKLPLPAPPASEANAPGNSTPYATYNIDVSRAGYFNHTYQNVPIFDRITALQPVELVPLSANGTGDNFTPYDTRFYESENPSL